MNRKKLIIAMIAAIVLVFIIFWIVSSIFAGTKTTYMTSEVKKGDIEVSVLATGILKPHGLVAVGARATGRIISMHVKPGDVVKKGDLLAEIDPITQENDLKSKRAALDNYRGKLAEQEAQLILSQQNLTRQKNMITSNAVSHADLDSADAQVKVNEALITQYKAQIIQAEVDVETAQVDLSYTRVTAPSDGTVLAAVVQEGQNVNAVQSAPTIVILGDLSVMTVRAEISEADVVNVKAGSDLYFNVIGNPNRKYEGKLDKIEPSPESIRTDISFNSSTTSSTTSSAIYYNGTFDVDNKDNVLKTYMTAEVHIIQGRAKDVLLIPTDALETADTGHSAKVKVLVGDGEVVEKTIEIGLNNKVMVEVKSGLKLGDKVITGTNDGSTVSTSSNRGGKGPR